MKFITLLTFLFMTSSVYACDTVSKKELVYNNAKNIVNIYDGNGKEAKDLYAKIKEKKADFPEFNAFLAVKIKNGKFVLALFKDECLLAKSGTFIGNAEEASKFLHELNSEYLMGKLGDNV